MDFDMGNYLRFVVALVFVIGLIALFATLARRAGWGFPTSAIKRADSRRLSVVEVTPLDGRRRMILIRRDNTEHLLLVGPTSETVLESGITDGPTALENADLGSRKKQNTLRNSHSDYTQETSK